MIEEVTCNVCGSSRHELLSKKGQFNIPLNVVICRNCGLVYLNPRWSREEYLNFYQNEYDKYYRPHVLNANKIENKQNVNPIVERLKRNNLLPRNVDAILDVGSGEGVNLSDFTNIFPNIAAHAIEPSKHSSKALADKGYHIIAEDAESDWTGGYDKMFDIVIMRHVLEHFLDPLSVLKKVQEVMKDDGILYLAVPNCLKPTGLLQSYWFRVVHTFYFNKFTLSNILHKAGLHPVQLTEGDEFNKGEIFVVARKSKTKIDLTIAEEHYRLQKNVLAEKIKEENSFSHRFSMTKLLVKQRAKRLLKRLRQLKRLR